MGSLTLPGGANLTVPDDFESWAVADQDGLVEEFLSSPEYARWYAPDGVTPPRPDALPPIMPAAPAHQGNLMEQVGSGLVEGSAMALGLPGDILQGLVNNSPFTRQPSLGDANPPWAFMDPVDAPGTTDEWLQRAEGQIAPVDPDYAIARRAAQILPSLAIPIPGMGATAPARVANAGRAAVRNPGLIRRAGREVTDAVVGTVKPAATATAMSVASAAGGEVGGDLAEEFGLPRGVGQMVGELGGMAGPSLARTGLESVPRAVLGAPGDARRIALLDRYGIEPSFGLVGNSFARTLENTLGYFPASSSMVNRRQKAQVGGGIVNENELKGPPGAEQMSLRAQKALRDPSLQGTPIIDDNYELGVYGREAASGGLSRARGQIGRYEQEMLRAQGGATQPVDVQSIVDDFTSSITGTPGQVAGAIPQQRAVLRQALDELDDLRFSPHTGGDIDAQLGQRLRTDLGLAQNDLAITLNQLTQLKKQPSPPPRQVQALEQQANDLARDVSDLTAQIRANTGVQAGALDKWRSQHSHASGTGPSLNAMTEGGANRSVAAAAERASGHNAAAYRDALEGKRRLAGSKVPLDEGGDINFLKNLSEKHPHQIANDIHLTNAADNLLALRRNVSDAEWGEIASSYIRWLGQPTSATARAGALNTETFSPTLFATKWKNLPEASKQALAPNPAIRQELDDLAEIADMLVKRGRAASLSQTGAIAITAGSIGTASAGIAPWAQAGTHALTGAMGSKAFNDYVIGLLAQEYPEILAKIGRQGLRGTVGVGMSSGLEERGMQ